MDQWLKNIDQRIGYYIAGFTDGEGSFNVSIKKRNDFRGGWRISPSFNISQKDRVILARIKHVLGCGTLRERHDGVVYYEVTNLHLLYERIIPFFKRFRFLSANKKKNFSIFEQIVNIMFYGAHLAPDGLKKVLALRERLNEPRGRERKYTMTDVMTEGSSSYRRL